MCTHLFFFPRIFLDKKEKRKFIVGDKSIFHDSNFIKCYGYLSYWFRPLIFPPKINTLNNIIQSSQNLVPR